MAQTSDKVLGRLFEHFAQYHGTGPYLTDHKLTRNSFPWTSAIRLEPKDNIPNPKFPDGAAIARTVKSYPQGIWKEKFRVWSELPSIKQEGPVPQGLATIEYVLEKNKEPRFEIHLNGHHPRFEEFLKLTIAILKRYAELRGL